MPNSKKVVYVVSVVFPDGKKQYYVKTYFKEPEGFASLSEPFGIFSYNLVDAFKTQDKSRAEWIASYFDNAKVECIKEGERLK